MGRGRENPELTGACNAGSHGRNSTDGTRGHAPNQICDRHSNQQPASRSVPCSCVATHQVGHNASDPLNAARGLAARHLRIAVKTGL